MELTPQNALKVLKKYLGNNEEKYNHSIRVAKVSKELAQIWEVPEENVIIASLLHDIGKIYSRKELLDFCSRNNIIMHDFEIFDNTSALHGQVSADLFEKEFSESKGQDNFEEIKNAIANHVAGHRIIEQGGNLSLTDKILFVADSIEPEIKDSELLEKIKSGEINNINECIRIIIDRKKERSIKRDIAYNPGFDVMLESLENEDEER